MKQTEDYLINDVAPDDDYDLKFDTDELTYDYFVEGKSTEDFGDSKFFNSNNQDSFAAGRSPVLAKGPKKFTIVFTGIALTGIAAALWIFGKPFWEEYRSEQKYENVTDEANGIYEAYYQDFTDDDAMETLNTSDEYAQGDTHGDTEEASVLYDILVKQLGDVNIADFCEADFDFDGDTEAFAVVGNIEEDGSCYGSLYFVTQEGIEPILSNEGFWTYGESKHMLEFTDSRFYVVGKYYTTGDATYVFGVSEHKWYEDPISLRGMNLAQVSGTNDLSITYSAYDSSVDGYGHTWKPYYLYWDNGFHEYGGIIIDAADFMLCNGGSEIYNQIIDKGFTVTGIIYRANGVININYTDGSSNFNATALLNDSKVTLQHSNDDGTDALERSDYGGIYDTAFLADMATYPTAFPLSSEDEAKTDGSKIPSDAHDSTNSDFDQIIEGIRQNYYYIQENINSFTLNEADGVYQWYIDSNAILRKAVVFADEMALRERTEEYYYDSDGNLTFCFAYDSAGNELRFYFHKRLLYRFIDETGNVMDFPDGTEPYSVSGAGEIYTNADYEKHFYYG